MGTGAPPGGIPLDDRGLLLGDGLFETLLFTRGDLVLAVPHAERMARGAAALDLPAPGVDGFIESALAAVQAAGLAAGRAAVRVTLTAGSGGRGLDRPQSPELRLFATAGSATRPAVSAALIVAQTRRNQASPASRMKTLAYLDNVLARREAAAAGADEAVMLNTLGEVACAAAANLFWVEGDNIFTPALATGRLDGIMAGEVTDAAARLGLAVHQVRAGVEALHSADALFLTNSLIGIRPAYLAGSAPSAPHPVLERLAAEVALLT
jgi:branched-chain amino acid aminotransferase/4-amino-4-deoxychorismate lyase